MKRKRKRSPSYRYFLSVVALSSYNTLSANPEGMQVVHGTVQSSSSENVLEIHSGQKAIINWDSFSIATRETTKFIQHDANSAVLNRVIGNNLSEIYGALESNGKIFLINPSGIIVGDGARVEVGSFIASTFDILNDDFLADSGITFSGDSDRAFVNLGTIQAKEGDVILIAHRIQNDGAIEAPQGTVHLALGHEVLLLPASGKVLIRPGAKTTYSEEEGYGIENNGSIKALAAELKSDPNIYGRAIKDVGSIEAIDLVEKNGHVYLVAESGRIEVSGTVTAKNQEVGGTIHILGDQIGIIEKGFLDASGNSGGGEILIGGDKSGNNPMVPNASHLLFEPGAIANVDCFEEGNGGKIILFAEKSTGFYGNVYANAGALGGDGGFVEVSGREYLDFGGQTFFGFPLGQPGTLYIDPIDVIITPGTTSTCVILPPPNNSNVVAGCGGTSPTYINTTTLNSTLTNNLVHLIIDTNVGSVGPAGNITVQDPSSTLSWSSASRLDLIATNNITILNDITPNTGGQTPTSGIGLYLSAGGTVLLQATTSNLSGINNKGTLSNVVIDCSDFKMESSNGSNGSNYCWQTGTGEIIINAKNNVSLQRTTGSIGVNQISGSATVEINAGGHVSLVDNCNIIGSPIKVTAANMSFSGGTGIFDGSGMIILPSSEPSTIAITDKISMTITGSNTTSQIAATGTSPLNVSFKTMTVDTGSGIDNTVGISSTGPINITATDSGASITLTSGAATGGTARILSSADKVSINMPLGTLTLGSSGDSTASTSIIGGNSVAITTDVLSLTSTGDMQSSISSMNGDLDLTIGPGGMSLSADGNLPTSIQSTGTGNINIYASDGALMQLSSNGLLPAAQAVITTGSGNIKMTATSTGNLVRLLFGNLKTSSAVFTSGGGSIDINFGKGSVYLGNISSDIPLDSSSSIYTNAGGNIQITAGSVWAFTASSRIAGTRANAEIYTNAPNSSIAINSSDVRLKSQGASADSIPTIYTNATTGNNPITISCSTLLLEAGTNNLATNSYANISTVVGDINITASTSIILNSGTAEFSYAQIASSDSGNIIINGPGSISLMASSGVNSYAQILSSTGYINIGSTTPASSIFLQGGSGTNSYAEIHTAASGDISLTGSSITLKAGDSSNNGSALISTDTSGNIALKGHSLSMFGGSSSSGIDLAEIVTNGTNNTIMCNFTGPVTLMGGSGGSMDVNALITTVNATGNNSITISSGDLTLDTSSLASSDFSNAEISTSSGNITITATGDVLLENGIGQTNALITASGFPNGYGAVSIISSGSGFQLLGGDSEGSSLVAIETTDGGEMTIKLNSSNANVDIMGGAGSVSPAYIQTLAGGDITITQNGGSFDIEGGSGALSQGAVQTLAGGSISFLASGAGANILLRGGQGPTSDAWIQTSSTGTGNITIDSQSLSLIGGESIGSATALIATGSGLFTSALTIDVTNLVSLKGGGSTGNDTATIEALGTTSNTMAFTAGSVEMEGGTGFNSSSSILTTDSDLTIHLTKDTLSMKGGSGNVSNAIIATQTGGNVTINAPSANMSLHGGSSSNESYAVVIPALTSGNGNLNVTGNNISLMGGSGSGDNYATLATGSASTSSSFNVTSNGNLSLQGGNGTGPCYASITNAAGDVGTTNSITVKNNLSLIGGNSSVDGSATIELLSAGSILNIGVTNLAKMNGGDGSNSGNNQASISIPSTDILTFSAGGLEVAGGSAPVSYASLESTDTALTVTITGSPVKLTGGSGTSSYAFMGTANDGSVTLAAPHASISLTGGSGLDSSASIVPSLSGSGPLVVTGGTLTMLGGNGSGNDNAILTGPNSIQITLTGNGSLTGGTAAGSNNNALIQATGGNPITISAASLSVNGTKTSGANGALAAITTDFGDIQMTLSGSLTVAGGVANHAPATISADEADINVHTVQNVTVTGGSGNESYGRIGRANSTPDPTNITFSNVKGNVEVTCQTGQNSYALIGFGSPILTGSNEFLGDLNFPSIHGNVTLTSGSNTGSFAQIGVVNSTSGSTTTNSDITLHANGNVTLTSFPGTNAYALIGQGGQMSTGSENFFGDISLTANNLFLNRDSLTTGSSFSIVGFASPSTANHPLQINSDFITVQTNQNIDVVDLLGLSSAAGIGAFALSSDPLTSVTITNLNLLAGGSINYLVSPLPYSSSLNFIGTVLDRNALGTASTNITIQAGGNFDFANFAVLSVNESLILNCNPNNFSLHHDPISISVGGNFTAEHIFSGSMIIFSSGELNVNAGNDILLSGFITSQDGMLMKAGNNFTIEPYGVIKNAASGSILFVCDNQNPDSPAFGANTTFSLFAPATITNQNDNGPVGIYSTTQANTSIGDGRTPSLNGAIFRPGVQFVDTPREKWFVYYPDGTISIIPSFFSIFYKAGSTEPTPPPGPTPVQIEGTIYHADLLISQMLFYEFPILDEYLFWAERFDIKYNHKAYTKLKKKWGYLSSFDLIPKQRFTQERKRYFEKYDFIDLLLKREIRN